MKAKPFFSLCAACSAAALWLVKQLLKMVFAAKRSRLIISNTVQAK